MIEAGLDEVGRGALAGPLVVALAVKIQPNEELGFHPSIWVPVKNAHDSVESQCFDSFLKLWGEKENHLISMVTRDLRAQTEKVCDSKKLSSSQRERLLPKLLSDYRIYWSWSDSKTIDQENILRSTLYLMKSLATYLKEKEAPKTIQFLIDGNQEIPDFSGYQQAIVRGDEKIEVISAASVFAKVLRDTWMKWFHEHWDSRYGFAQHKGYGTAQHRKAIDTFGLSPIHRRTFWRQSKITSKEIDL